MANTLDTSCNQGIFVQISEELTVYAVWYPKKQCYIAIRKLTPKECFRLQGWTDDYFEKAQLVNSDSQLYKQAGNGVTVNVIEAIAKNMYKEGLMKECCGNCKHNKYAPDGNGVRNGKFYCDNEESSEYGVPTFYDDSCDDWEEKE